MTTLAANQLQGSPRPAEDCVPRRDQGRLRGDPGEATPAQSQLTGTPKTHLPSAASRAMVDRTPIAVAGKSFDYGSLPTEIAEDLRERTGFIREQVKNTTDAVVFSVRSAQNFIRVADFTRAKTYATIAYLPLAVLYALSAKSTPPEIVQEVLARAAARAPVSTAELKRMLLGFKHRNRQGMPGNGRREPSSCEREQAKNEMARANARALVKRFGGDGAAFILEMQDNILETLSFLESEICVHPGGTA
jgi:hypothetical protein